MHSQVNQDDSKLKGALGISAFYQYYPITNLNLNDSIIGRTNISLINLNTQYQLYKYVYGGFKVHYNISNSYLFASTSNNFKGNYKIGPKLGLILLNHKKSFFFSPDVNFLYSNFELKDDINQSNIIIHTGNLKLGIDINTGLKLRNNLFLTAGLSLNNFFKTNYEFNYFNVGLSHLFIKDNKKTLDQKPSF